MDDSDIYRVFCENVDDRLAGLGWSRSRLANRMGVGIAYVTSYLNGHRRPGIDVISRFARGLKVDESALLRKKRKMAKA